MTRAHPPGRRALAIQYEVIKALILRETITRWNRRNIGFLWLFVEPLIFMFAFSVIWGLSQSHSIMVPTKNTGVTLYSLMLIGHPCVMLLRISASSLSNATKSNSGLFHHPNLKPLDFYIARFIMEIVALTGAFLAYLILSIFLGWASLPKDISRMTAAWALYVWFALGWGLTLGVLITQFEVISILWKSFMILLFVLTGAYFFVGWFPLSYRKLLLLIPMISGSEMMKHGYYGDAVKTYEDPMYLIKWCIFLMFTGLCLVKYYGKHIPSRL